MKDPKRRDHERLIHIRDAAGRIENFTLEMNEADFLTDDLVLSAVLFQFSVIGEAVKHIGSDHLDKYKYPWHRVRAFRNLISHAYFHVKPQAVWNVIKNDLPGLKYQIEEILKQEF